jgi:non-ribosomal peptide synthetase component F
VFSLQFGFGSIERNADKIGMVVGALGALGTDPLNQAMATVQNLMAHPQFPDVQWVARNLTDTGHAQGKVFTSALMAVIGGWILKEIDIHPAIGRAGRFLFDAGIGAAEAAAVISALNSAAGMM